MFLSARFLINSILFGMGLAMDAFSVSVAAGLQSPHMSKGRMLRIAGTFSFFQIAMPLIGWFCVHTMAERFARFEKAVPWIALILLLFLGGRMIAEELVKHAEGEKLPEEGDLSGGELIAQGIATSIDALSVGFTIADLGWQAALLESVIIGAVTLLICLGGLRLGRSLGKKLAGKAGYLGGIILILIGLNIFFN